MKKKRAVIKSMSHSDHKSSNFEIVSFATSSPISITTLDYDILEPPVVVVGVDAFDQSVEAVEQILKYRFKDRSLIQAALTHSSFTASPSYQRLEFVGDAALGLALANFVFIAYPDLHPGQLSLLRSANISTEKLARVAVTHGLFRFVRHNAPALQVKVDEFADEIRKEGDEILPFGGLVKAPKVLADIVESIAAAVYVDCNFNLVLLWEIFGHILEPIVTPDNIQLQPVTALYELCQKLGKTIDFKYWRNGAKNITNLYVDGKLVSTASSEQKETSKLVAAKDALQILTNLKPLLVESNGNAQIASGVSEIREAKQKLIEHCSKNGFQKPKYSIVKQEGPSHDRRFVCSVQIVGSGSISTISGNVKTKRKDAENSAASMMLHVLKDA